MFEHVRSEKDFIQCPSVFFFCSSKIFEFFDSYFQEKAVPQTVARYEFTRLSKMQHNVLFFFACLNFELTSSKDI